MAMSPLPPGRLARRPHSWHTPAADRNPPARRDAPYHIRILKP